MILCVILNVQKINAQDTIKEKKHVETSRDAIYFSIIAMPKKSHFTIFAVQNFVQNTKNTREFHLHCWDVCKVNKWCLAGCFHREFRVSTQITVRDYCIAKCKKFSTCGGE